LRGDCRISALTLVEWRWQPIWCWPRNGRFAQLESAVARLYVLAQSHDHLRIMTGDHATDEVDADRVVTNTQKPTRIGLIVNELVTNAFEACVSGRRCWDHWVKLRTPLK
jgi:hypothetical protein